MLGLSLKDCNKQQRREGIWKDCKKQWRRENRNINIIQTTDLGMNIRRKNVKNDICTHAQYFAHAHALKCLFVNARRLVSKIDNLKMQIYEMEIDIIGVAEMF